MPIPPEIPSDAGGAGSSSGESAGLKDGVRELLRTLLRHLHLRVELFGLEAGAAAGHVGRTVAAVAVAVAGAGLAYLSGWAALVVWAARRWAGGDVAPPLAVMAGVHVVASVGAVWWLKARARQTPLFPATRAEFAEDKKWINRRQA